MLNIIKTEDGYDELHETKKDNHHHFSSVTKFYKMLKKEQSFMDVMKNFNLSQTELYGLLELCEIYGLPISMVNYNNEIVIKKT